MKLEVVILPVSDVDRAKRFYADLGWRMDADFANDKGWRVVQMTPPGSPCSVIFGAGITTAAPGSVQGSFLIVDDIHAARANLVAHGASVSEVFHFDGGLHVTGTDGRLSGPHPAGESYRSWLSFSDPDGNGWLLQEIKTRLPGRGFASMDVATLTELLRDAENHHGGFEASAEKHHWSGYYAAFVVARQRGKTPEEAASEAALQIERELMQTAPAVR
jgi:catechol 2,3-dioxygenase-like lactoylglutathione lyase family enzyme